ncbi:MAG: DNA-3-methyladenine glycosylase I [Alphaproteobacteria bacterium]|nr:DNA-3-methyladenine glycosylase I [Alphaproteobacteria bacterium]
MVEDGLVTGTDGKARCWWCGNDPLYIRYHDEEWGKPVYDDVRLFEKICLEGFQAGLSWLTILRKKENFRAAFAGFDFNKIIRFDENSVEAFLKNPGIIRHRGKIEAMIHNAGCAIKLVEEYGSLAEYFRSFRPDKDTYTPRVHRADIPVKTAESVELSKDLKHRGWKFTGPTICYAFMQATGIVNDHMEECYCWKNTV